MSGSSVKGFNNKVRKIELQIDRKADMYKMARNISYIGSAFTFLINPLLSVPSIYLASSFNNKYKEFSDNNKNLHGDKLKPIGEGHGDKNGNGASGIFFGIDEYGLPIHLSDKEMTTHGIIFGATGSGKTTTIFNIMKQHIIRGGGFIFIDGKSENPTWTNVYDMALEQNREDEVFLLSFRASVESSSNSWNFLMSGSSSQIGEMLAELSLPSDAGQNQIFVDRGKQLLYSLLSVATYFRDVKKQIITFNDLIQMLKPDCLLAILRPTKEEAEEDEKTAPFAKYWIPEDYVETGMSTPAKDMLRNFAENIGASRDGYVDEQQMKLFKDQHSFAAMQFGPMFNDLSNTYGKIFNTTVSDIDINDIIANNRILYVLLPALEKSASSLQGLGKMVLAAVKQAASATLGNITEGYRNSQMLREERKKRSKPPFLVIADEYGSYAIKGFSDVLAQARSLGIGVIISIQEKASLEKAGAEEAKRILGNTVWKMFLKIEELETAKLAIEVAGKVRIAESSSQKLDKNIAYDKQLETEEQYNIIEKDVISTKLIREVKNGAGIFIVGEDTRDFQGPYFEPDKASSIWLNRLYPTIKLELADNQSKPKDSKLIEEEVFDS